MEFNTYVINLDEQHKRYESQEKKLNGVGIYPVRISGNYRKDVSKSIYDKHFHSFYKHYIPDSVIGATSSHLKAIQYFLDNDTNEVALILEDDAYPLFDNVMYLRDKLNDRDWEMLLLHCDGLCSNKWTRPNILTGSVAAYFITREGAQKILNHKFRTYLDIDTNNVKNLKKRVDKKSSFWADEEGIMSGEKGVSRDDSGTTCPSIFKFVSPFIISRGEKTLCHVKNYKAFKIPYIERNVTHGEIFLMLCILSLLIVIKKSVYK